MQHLWVLHDVVAVWPGSYNNVAPDFQYPKCRNTSQQGGQYVASNNVAICCVDILRSFGQSFQCWANNVATCFLNVAIVWPGLKACSNDCTSFSRESRAHKSKGIQKRRVGILCK